MVKEEMTLKVAESISQRDIGHNIARLDPTVMEEMGLKEKDVIEIVGDRKTGAIVLPSQTDIELELTDLYVKIPVLQLVKK